MIAKQIQIDRYGRGCCGRCGHPLDMNEKTERKCSQCGCFIIQTDYETLFVRLHGKKTRYLCETCQTVNIVTDQIGYNYCCGCGHKISEFLEPVTNLQDFLKEVQGSDES